MQELMIAKQLLEQSLTCAESLGAKRIRLLHGRVLNIQGLSVKELRAQFKEYAKGTAAEDASLTIETKRIQARCLSCDRIVEPAPFLKICSWCGDERLELFPQPSIEILRLEVDGMILGVEGWANQAYYKNKPH